MRHPSYSLLVFDWDGTLLDSINAIVRCTQATLDRLGLPEADEDNIRSGIGLGIRETVEFFCPGRDEDTFRRICEVYRELWFGGFSKEPVLFDGVRELLEALSEEGRLLAVATAKSRKGLAADLERTGLGHFFGASRTVDEAPSKPNPEMLLGILEELGIGRESALMIGDAVHDLEMANNARVAALGVVSGTTEREVLAGLDPLDCLDRVTALPAWLERNPPTVTRYLEAGS